MVSCKMDDYDKEFKKGDRIEYANFDGIINTGVIEKILSDRVMIKWDDGFDDGAHNLFHPDELRYESHTCPFAVEINDNFDECNCGPEKTQECRWDI